MDWRHRPGDIVGFLGKAGIPDEVCYCGGGVPPLQPVVRAFPFRILFPEIEDDPRNHIRFFAISREPVEEPEGQSKTSLAFFVAHEPGSLHRALGAFADMGVDLTKLESRPILGRPWEYRFFADVREDPKGAVGECLEKLRSIAAELRVLGSYEEWPEVE